MVRHFLLLPVTLFALSGPVFGQTLPTVGYYDVSAPFVPEPVRKAADSVFEIVVLSPSVKESLDAESLAQAEETIESSDRSPQEKQLLLAQVKYCKAMKLVPCDVHFGVSSGSAFLLDDGQTLWTDYHVIQRYVKDLAKHFKRREAVAFLTLRHQNLPIAIFDRNQRMVFLGSKSDGHAQVVAKAFDGDFVGHIKGEHRSTSDFAKIRLSRSIGPALKSAATVPTEGAAVFALGFPTGTGPHATIEDGIQKSYLVTRAPFPDSEGNSLYVSPGRVLEQYQGWKRVLKINDGRDLTPEEFNDLKLKSIMSIGDSLDIDHLVLTEMDAIFGNSGGPVVNTNGEVIGMAGSVAIELKDGRYVRTTVVNLNMVGIEKRSLAPGDNK